MPFAKPKVVGPRCRQCYLAEHDGKCTAVCPTCSKGHWGALCPEIFKKDKKTTVSVNSVNNTNVCLPTLSIPIRKGNSRIIARTLLDQASQRSLIEERFVDKHDLEVVGETYITLQGYGTTNVKRELRKIVRLKIPVNKREDIEVKAVVVEILPTITSRGIHRKAKQLSQLNINLADSFLTSQNSDDIEISLLIGNEYYYSIVHPHICPR